MISRRRSSTHRVFTWKYRLGPVNGFSASNRSRHFPKVAIRSLMRACILASTRSKKAIVTKLLYHGAIWSCTLHRTITGATLRNQRVQRIAVPISPADQDRHFTRWGWVPWFGRPQTTREPQLTGAPSHQPTEKPDARSGIMRSTSAQTELYGDRADPGLQAHESRQSE